MRPHSPSFQLPQPSFRRKPESRTCGHNHRHSSPPTVIPAKAGIYARRPHYRLPQPSYQSPQPSFRRKPESRPCGHLRRHSGSPNRHSAASRNPRRKETLPPAPAKFPIRRFTLPDPQRRPQSGHTSHPPTCSHSRMAVAPHASHRQGDPPPSRFAPLPGILDVGDSGSRFGCPQPAPSAPPSKIPKIPAQ